jgi:hypothetical protein
MKIIQIRGRMRSPYDGRGAVPGNKSMKVDTLRNNAINQNMFPAAAGRHKGGTCTRNKEFASIYHSGTKFTARTKCPLDVVSVCPWQQVVLMSYSAQEQYTAP